MSELHAIFAFFGLSAGGAVVWICKQCYNMFKTIRQEEMIRKRALKAILHSMIYKDCHRYLKNGSITIDDMEDLTYMFDSYKALGGNGTAEKLYNETCALPKI